MSTHGWEPEREPPSPAPGQPWAHPSPPRDAGSRSSSGPVGWKSPGVGVSLGEGCGDRVPRPAPGCGGTGPSGWWLGAEGSATHLPVAEEQLLEWLQLGLPGSRRCSAQPSTRCRHGPAHGGAEGWRGPPSGHCAHSQAGKLRHKAHQPAGKQPQAAHQPVPSVGSQRGWAAAPRSPPCPGST